MNAHSIFIDRYPYLVALKIAVFSTVLTVALFGCSNIWNAGDLVNWVKDRAVDQGCQRETIELEEWYTETVEGNVWQGTCREAQGNIKSFGINVDPVWTPSAIQSERAAPATKSEKY